MPPCIFAIFGGYQSSGNLLEIFQLAGNSLGLVAPAVYCSRKFSHNTEAVRGFTAIKLESLMQLAERTNFFETSLPQ